MDDFTVRAVLHWLICVGEIGAWICAGAILWSLLQRDYCKQLAHMISRRCIRYRTSSSFCPASRSKRLCDQLQLSSMNQCLEKRIPIRLVAQDYKKLRQRVLRRDSWRCQFCGSRHNLEVHHQQFRSHSGEDDERNLITLCNDCHSSYHGAWPRPIREDLMRS
jgi:predicted HNH restriction endonuclease